MIELTIAGEKFRLTGTDWSGPAGPLLDLIRERSDQFLADTPVHEPNVEFHLAQQIAREARAQMVSLAEHEPPQADPSAIY